MEENIIERTKEKLIEYENRKQKILNAAMKLFNANGYAATTTANIAKEAQVTEKTMYRHFKNKQALFVACINSLVEELIELLESELEKYKDDSLAYLKAVVSSYVNFVINNPDKSMFLVHLYSYRGLSGQDEGFNRFVNHMLKDIEQAIKSMKDKGVIKSEIDSQMLSGVFVAQYFTMVFVNDFVEPEQFNEETVIEMAKNFLKIE